ncbi:YceI family protein [Kordia sp.]|uniref:YceI family protein n=1 Tax=Kordia sp. TaxID=1965332 RepID=UPI003B5AFD32
MKKIKNLILPVIIIAIIIVASGYTKDESNMSKEKEIVSSVDDKQHQTINFFVTHGHCSTPFAGSVSNMNIDIPSRDDMGNPLENLKLSFEVDPNTFNVCKAEELTETIRKPGLFVSERNEKITFQSTNIYTMGLDWYQINGTMSIKGIEKEVKFFVTGIRDPKESMSSALILSGQVNLFDWGIDYDKIVNGKSDNVPTKLLYLNMKIDITDYQPVYTVIENK